MEKVFAEKTARILMIDHSGAVRQLALDVLKSKGFTAQLQTASNIKDAIGILEVEPVDWVLSPLMTEDEVNGMQLLTLITKTTELANTKVTLMINESERHLLPFAFERGMLNYLEVPFNKQTLSDGIDLFLKTFEECGWNATKMASLMCLDVLRKSKDYLGQMSLLKGMLGLFPGEPAHLVKLIEPTFHLGDVARAKALIKQIKLIDQEYKPEAEAIEKELFAAPPPPKEAAPGSDDMEIEGEDPVPPEALDNNILGIKTCVLVDPDIAVRAQVATLFAELGVPVIQKFSDGEEAAAWCETNQPDLVMHDWQIPKLSSPYLIQRLRKQYPKVHIICFTGVLKLDDLPILKEMGITTIIEKPLDRKKTIKEIIRAIQDDRSPTDAETFEAKIRQCLEAEDREAANDLKRKYDALTEIPESRKVKIAAEFAYYDGDYKKARELTVQAIATELEPVYLIGLLGKILMKLGDFEPALQCFEKAQMMSPHNIQRLCSIAEANMEANNPAAAEKAIEAAKTQDPNAPQITETEAKIAVDSGETDRARELMRNMSSLSKVISHMNNKAVALARAGNPESSYEVYAKTLESIPEERKEILAVVNYNLSLAYTRNNQLEKAMKQIEAVLKLGPTRVLKKASSLLKRLDIAKKKGIQIRLKDGHADEKKTKGEGQDDDLVTQSEVMAAIKVKPGDLCIHRVYFDPASAKNEVANKLVAKVPHFKHRKAIERGATTGADKAPKKDG